MRTRRKFSREFKLEAVKLMQERGVAVALQEDKRSSRLGLSKLQKRLRIYTLNVNLRKRFCRPWTLFLRTSTALLISTAGR